MLKLVTLTVIVALCSTEAAVDVDDKLLGEDNYLPCEKCYVPKHEYPEEGKMACYSIRRYLKVIPGKVQKCKYITPPCQPFQPCPPRRLVCSKRDRNITMLDCELFPRNPTKEIDQRNETYGTIYQINSPRYFGYNEYPNNTYCIWNIANSDFVTYRIVDQKLQEPQDCDKPECRCPDGMMLKMGANEIKLCGSKMPSITNQVSADGLNVHFCSDNQKSHKGVLVMAYRHTSPIRSLDLLPDQIVDENRIVDNAESRKRRQNLPNSCPELSVRVDEMATNMSEMGCQYEYMMRASQPGVPCPDDKTIMTLVKNHEYMVSDFQQTMPMCDGMDTMSNRMPMMTNIESCAVDYLYRTRDCEFAKKLIDSTNGELSDVARMISKNKFPIKVPKWANITRTNCKRSG